MPNIKLNSTKKEEGFDVIPDLNNDNVQKEENQQSYVKQENVEESRKLFANKKANMALIFAGIIFGLVVIGCLYYIYKPM